PPVSGPRPLRIRPLITSRFDPAWVYSTTCCPVHPEVREVNLAATRLTWFLFESPALADFECPLTLSPILEVHALSVRFGGGTEETGVITLGLAEMEPRGSRAPTAEPILLAGVGLCPIRMRMGAPHDAPSSASHPEPSAGPDLTPIRPDHGPG